MTKRWPASGRAWLCARSWAIPTALAESLRELGVTLRALGLREEARAHWRHTLAILEQLRTTDADQVRALTDDFAGHLDVIP